MPWFTCVCYTEKAKAWHRHERHSQWRKQNHQQTAMLLPNSGKKKQIGHHARPRRASATAPLRTGADTCKTGSGAGKHAGAKSDAIPRRTHSTKTWTPVTSHTADQQALLQGKFPMNLGYVYADVYFTKSWCRCTRRAGQSPLLRWTALAMRRPSWTVRQPLVWTRDARTAPMPQ